MNESCQGQLGILYRVIGFEGERFAGPYPQDQLNSHLEDIRGFEGVYGAHIGLKPKEA